MTQSVRIVLAGLTTTAVRDLLERAGLRVVAEAETQDKAIVLAAERSAGAIVHVGAPEVHCGTSIPTVVVGDEADIASAAELGAFAAVGSAVSEAEIAAVVDVAVERFADLVRAHDEIAALRDQLETRKTVERAKGILMSRLKLSEQDAYRRLQKASQDENRKMRDIAESVIQTEKIMSVEQDEERQGGSRRSFG